MAFNTALQKILRDYASLVGGISSPKYLLIVNALNSSSALENQFNFEAAAGRFRAISYTPSDLGASFNISEGAIVLTESYLNGVTLKPDDSNQMQSQKSNDLLFVLSHEVRHGVNAPTIAAANITWFNNLRTSISSWNATQPLSNPQDFTSAIRERVTRNLQDEGVSNIQGWNAVLSAVVKRNGGYLLTPEQLKNTLQTSGYGQLFYNDEFVLKRDYEVDEFGFLLENSINVSLAAQEVGRRSPSTTNGTGTTYYQFYTADALNNVFSLNKGRPLLLDYVGLELTVPSVSGDPNQNSGSRPPLTILEVNKNLVGLGFFEPGPNVGDISVIVDSVSGQRTTFERTDKKIVTLRNPVGLPATDVQPTNTTELEYDSLGRLISSKTINSSGQILEVTKLTYSQVDSVTQITAITAFSNGASSEVRFKDGGTLISKVDSKPTGLNSTQVETYTYSTDGRPILQSTRNVEIFFDENGQSRIETTTTFGQGFPRTVRTVYNNDNTVFSTAAVPTPTSTYQVADPRSITALNDIASLIDAIQRGKPLPILNSGLTLLNNVNNTPNVVLSNVTGFVGGVSSIYNLYTAVKSGDGLTTTSAALSSLNYVNRTLPTLLNNGANTVLNSGLNTVLNGSGTAAGGAFAGLGAGNVPGVLPVLGLIISIRSGDPIGITSGLIGLINPALLSTPVGWILAGASILKALLSDNTPPEAWGTGRYVFGPDGQIKVDVVGVSFGQDRVRQQLDFINATLSDGLARAQAANPSVPLGIIAQRMPGLTWREARQQDRGYALMDIDPLTGSQRYPYLRFDDEGKPFSSNPALWQVDAADPNLRQSMVEQLLNNAIKREAIAAQWEVDTAKIQATLGDPNAGLIEQ